MDILYNLRKKKKQDSSRNPREKGKLERKIVKTNKSNRGANALISGSSKQQIQSIG